jgi:hypothetical protein
MPNAVYHRFTVNDKFETRVMTWPSVVIYVDEYGSWFGNLDTLSGSMSLYGGVRARSDVFSGSTSGLQIYPLDDVDTNSIDKVIQISGTYPATGSINLVRCTNDPAPNFTNITDTRWYEEHYRVIEILYDFHSKYRPSAYQFDTASYSDVRLFHIPSMYYGNGIVTGTVTFSDYTASPILSFVDDCRGALVLSGTREQWGSIFYNEGLIVFTPPAVSSSYIPMNGVGSYNGMKMLLSFSGSNPIITKTFMCRIHESECNCSKNQTWSTEISGTRYRSGSDNTTYISSVGLYNENYELVAVAKIAQPIRKREQDRLDIRLRIDF